MDANHGYLDDLIWPATREKNAGWRCSIARGLRWREKKSVYQRNVGNEESVGLLGQVRLVLFLKFVAFILSHSSTRGLDASTAVEYVHALRIATNIVRVATIVSIYQAGESLYEMFDKVCLIYEGRMVYFGPANQARQYFVDMGYEPANRQTTSDFLVAVTDPNGRQVRDGMRGVPSTSEEFEQYYRRSSIMQGNLEDMASFREQYVGRDDLISAFRESAKAERARHMQKQSPYTISIPMQIRSVMRRRVQIQAGAVSLFLINTW